LHLRPTQASEAPLTRADVDEAIRSTGIIHGVMPHCIDEAWMEYSARGDSGSTTCIAEGTPPAPGRDAGIQLSIEHAEEPATDKEEKIDYRDLRLIVNVKKGQQIGAWKPAGFGSPGVGVDGSEVAPILGRTKLIEELQNVHAAETEGGTYLLTSVIDGMLQVQSHFRVRIVDHLDLEDSVDFQTGNIDANGSVRVGGCVRRDFKVNLRGDLTVKKNLEESFIRAGGKVVVGQGVFGGKNGRVAAGGRIAVQFCQNAHLIGGADIIVGDSDTRSVMECAGRIIAKQGRGHLLGGHYHAGKGMIIQELGSRLGVPTHVSVGRIPRTARRLRSDLASEGIRLDPLVENDQPVRITVLGTIHPGVVVEIRNARMVIDKPASNVMFEFDVKTRRVKMLPRS
jgi:uncharacterized protein